MDWQPSDMVVSYDPLQQRVIYASLSTGNVLLSYSVFQKSVLDAEFIIEDVLDAEVVG